MKLFTALLGTETNTFSPFLTGMQNFEQTYLIRNGDHGPTPSSFGVPLGPSRPWVRGTRRLASIADSLTRSTTSPTGACWAKPSA